MRRLLWLLLYMPALVMAEWHSDQQHIMGTVVAVKLWHSDAEVARTAIAEVMAEMHRIDDAFSPYKAKSELSQVNRRAAEETVAISEELAQLLDKALYFSKLSDGAFDISFASVGRHYDYREGQQPSEQQRRELLTAIDYRLIQLDRQSPSLRFAHPALQIDLGGIAKGYAVDRGAAILQGHGITSGTVSAGGDSRILGDKRGEPWVIGIKKPRGENPEASDPRDQVAVMLPLENVAISTSGDYERFFIDHTSGERVHHILNPRTGTSATGIVSASVLGPQGFDTDPLSTSVFVLGVTQGLALINQLPGFDCVIIDSTGKVHYSDGLAPPVDSSP